MRAPVVDVFAVLVRVFVMDAAAAMGMFMFMFMFMFVSMAVFMLMCLAGEAGPALRLADLIMVQ